MSTMTVRYQLAQAVALGALWFGLVAWDLAAPRLGCSPSGLVLLALTVVLGLSATEVAFYRRRAFLAQYLNPQGWLFRLLRRRSLIMLWQGVKSMALSLVLLVSSIGFDTLVWVILLADVLLVAVLTAGFSAFLGRQVKPLYQAPMIRHWALRTNALLLWGALALGQFYSAHSNYTGLHWQDVVRFSIAQVDLGCDVLAALVRLEAAGSALTLWAGQTLVAGPEQTKQLVIVWLVLIASAGVSFLTAWSYSRALMGTMSRPWRVWRPHGQDT